MENINLKLKIYLEDSRDKFMGIGVLWLLRKMEQNLSLRAAANDLGISYSKAFRMVENLESALGMKVLDRKKGGSSRGVQGNHPAALRKVLQRSAGDNQQAQLNPMHEKCIFSASFLCKNLILTPISVCFCI